MAIYFISDLHLDSERPHLTALFYRFLDHHLQDAECLYILGDLFEYWIGDDHLNAFNQQIMSKLRSITSNIPVYIIPGNRDFLLGENFTKATGCHLLADPSRILLYNKPTLICHGDGLCTLDTKHQKFRNISRNPNWNRWFLKLPLEIRKKIATYLRKKSQNHTKVLDQSIMDINFDLMLELMKQQKVQQIIYGHTHRPAIQWRNNKNQHLTIYVLSDWGKQGNFLHYSPNEMPRLVYFSEYTHRESVFGKA